MSLVQPSVLPVPAPAAPGPTAPAADLRGRCVLFLHAHPDDEAIFTGAVMYRLAAAGARVVLVTATGGELGPVLAPLRPGETLESRRRAELERACAALGVSRLVLLGHRDSGMSGSADNDHPNALARVDVPTAARRLAELALAEGAEAIVHYDPAGIYGHPDHIAVHRIGSAAADLAGLPAYQSTVDRDALAARRSHVVRIAAGDHPVGRPAAEVTTVVVADRAALAAKRAAMAAHASQMPPGSLRRRGFSASYGREWFLHRADQPTPVALDILADGRTL